MLEYWCPQRPKESVGSPRAGIAGVSEALECLWGKNSNWFPLEAQECFFISVVFLINKLIS